MKVFSLILHLLFLEQCLSSVLLSGGTYCDDGSNTVQHAVPGTTVSVSCSVDNPNGGLNVLAWTIQSYGVSVTNVDGNNADDADQPDFVSTVTSFNNSEGTTNATLTFTAVSALDGAVVNCRDVPSTISSCTLFIMTPPSVPTNLTCTNITTNSITIVWDLPVDNGGDPDGIYYEVTRTSGDTVIVTNTTSTMVTGLVFNTNYTFSIKANNSVGYSDSQSVVCTTNGEVFDQLPAGDIQVCLGSDGTSDYLLVNITSQDCPPVSPNVATTPDFDNFTITVSGYNSVSTPYCQYEQPISEEKNYNITVTINNIVGSSEPTTTQFDASWIRDIVVDLENSILSYSIPSCTILNGNPLVVLNIANTTGDVVYNEEQSYNTESTSFNIPCSSLSNTSSYNYSLLVTLSDRTVASYNGSLTSTTTMPTNEPTTPPADPTDDTMEPIGNGTSSSDTPSAESSSSVVPIVAGVVGAIVAVLVLIVLLVVVIFCCKKCKGRKSEQDNSDPIPLVQKNIPETGQGLYQDPTTIERHKAPTGDVYSVPDKSKIRPPPQPEMATYQDPSTIQRQQAPTGDLYALPDKKPVYSQNSEGTYADLDLVTGPRSPSGQPLISPSDRAPHKQVLYSDVQNFKSH